MVTCAKSRSELYSNSALSKVIVIDIESHPFECYTACVSKLFGALWLSCGKNAIQL